MNPHLSRQPHRSRQCHPAAVVQLDLTAFMQPLLAQIAALEAKLAAATQLAPQPRPVARRKSNAAMPMPVLV